MSEAPLKLIVRTPRKIVVELQVSSIRVPTETGQVGLRATGQVVLFDGFMKVYTEGRDDDVLDEDDKRLPQIAEGEPDKIGDVSTLADPDVVEAMSSHRPYRPALGIESALQEIQQNRERLYDADVVDACLRVFDQGFEWSTP